MWKWLLILFVVYGIYAFGQDQARPDQRRMAALERRVATLEIEMKAARLMRGKSAAVPMQDASSPDAPPPDAPRQP